MSAVGVIVMGLSVGLFSLSALGMDPFQILAHGIWRNTSLDFGLCYTIISVILLVLVLIFNRRKIGLGTLINIFLVGYAADFSEAFFGALLPERTIVIRLILLVVAVVIICAATALYFSADMGVSVYDAVALTVSERTPVPFHICRIVSDVICVIVGGILCFLSDGDLTTSGALLQTVGIGTIITAFFMGPLIAFFRKFTDKLVAGEKHGK